ncbi:hypothetical protein JD844_019402, partial [Phrynosoma platyrhinos]
HRGYCPRRESDMISSESCSWDTECALDEKCCTIEGNKRCTKAVPVNPGLCPKKALPPVFIPCRDRCRDDRSCPEGQKCCFVDCGLKCVPPESHHSGDQVELDRELDPEGDHRAPPRPGECPNPTLPGLPRPIQAYCVEDKPCPGEEKCCRALWHPCLSFFLSVHRGYCLRRESDENSIKICSSDTDCALDKKCCPSEGPQMCTKPVPANPGLCPKKALPPVFTPCKDKCRDDRSCPKGQKCCFIDCGLKCVPPESHHSGDLVELDRDEDEDAPLLDRDHGAPRKPGMCPSKTLQEMPRSGNAYCMEDAACPGDEKCCQCLYLSLSLAMHPGYCPNNAGAAASSLRCFWDTDCASDEKCCPSQEHKRCTKAVPGKVSLGELDPGTHSILTTPHCQDLSHLSLQKNKDPKNISPSSQERAGTVRIAYFHLLTRRLFLQKVIQPCIPNPSFHSALATPGHCPKKCLPWVFTRCANKCKDDRSCPDGQKCCFVECGLRCVPVERPHTGEQMELDQDQALLVPGMDRGGEFWLGGSRGLA